MKLKPEVVRMPDHKSFLRWWLFSDKKAMTLSWSSLFIPHSRGYVELDLYITLFSLGLVIIKLLLILR